MSSKTRSHKTSGLRSPALANSETWAGRGAIPRWLAAEIKAGKTREDFPIDRSAKKAKKRRKK